MKIIATGFAVIVFMIAAPESASAQIACGGCGQQFSCYLGCSVDGSDECVGCEDGGPGGGWCVEYPMYECPPQQAMGIDGAFPVDAAVVAAAPSYQGDSALPAGYYRTSHNGSVEIRRTCDHAVIAQIARSPRNIDRFRHYGI